MLLAPAALLAELAGVGVSGVARWALAVVKGWLTGSWAWAIVAAALVFGGIALWYRLDPPERTYTTAEVAVDRLARELAATKEALAVRDRLIAERDRVLAAAAETNKGLEDENEKLRAAAQARPGDGFTDADPWLQRKRARSGVAASRPR